MVHLYRIVYGAMAIAKYAGDIYRETTSCGGFPGCANHFSCLTY